MSGHTAGLVVADWRVSKATPTRVDTPNGAISISWRNNADDGATESAAEQAALLIAAAPELLEALQGLEPHLEAIVCYASTMGEHEPNRLVVNVRAAIAKATGDNP